MPYVFESWHTRNVHIGSGACAGAPSSVRQGWPTHGRVAVGTHEKEAGLGSRNVAHRAAAFNEPVARGGRGPQAEGSHLLEQLEGTIDLLRPSAGGNERGEGG